MTEKKSLFTYLHEGFTLITPNNRLTKELLTDFLFANPKSVQEKPCCYPYQAFLQTNFKKFCHQQSQNLHPLLLTEQQTHHLWGQILSKNATQPVNEGLVQAVTEAWNRCQSWQIDLNHPAFAANEQTNQFQLWASQFQKQLNQLSALTKDQLVNYLLDQRLAVDSKKLVWVCFDDYTPQQRRLQDYLASQNCIQEHYDLAVQKTNLGLYAAKNNQDEQQQLIYWLKERLTLGEKRIAVVVPDLQAQAKSLQRVLQRELNSTQFNLSLGEPLSVYPLVAHALTWLELDLDKLSSVEARLLLHSPYLAFSQSEMLARAELMESSTLLQEAYFSAADFIKEVKTYAPELAKALTGLGNYPEKTSIQSWIIEFKNRLQTLGFPGEYSLNSESYQCYQRLLTLFDDFKQLSLISPNLTQREALRAFKELAKTTIFQAQNTSASIQVLGLLEAAGSCFDSLWITGLTDQCLPAKARLSAFIPINLQRENLMPHASPTRELALAQKTLERLKNCSPHVIFSYPRLNGDKPNLASPLLDSLPLHNPCTEELGSDLSYLVNHAENYLLPFAKEEKSSGGTAILANQAKCPFRAFASHRLHAKAAVTVSEGPDARERGQLIHKVMELIWQQLQSQKNLLALNSEQLDQLIEKAIKTALNPLINQRSHSFSTLIQEVELNRLKRMVHACLDWERQRPHFEIEALEQAFTIKLAAMDFRVRVDRLDRVADGKKWVIDYKSSFPQSLPWKEERPKEPQLLLYALLDETINTLIFAQLKGGQLSCKGFSENEQELAGISSLKKDEDWINYRQEWQNQLNDLAEEFSKGHCPPKPATASLCQLCDFQNLCRFEVNT